MGMRKLILLASITPAKGAEEIRAGTVLTVPEEQPEAAELVRRRLAKWGALVTDDPARPLPVAPPASGASPGKPTAGPSPERLKLLVDAIDELPDDAFGQDGKPHVRALEAKLGGDVTAAERDAAWQAVQAAGGQAG